jgi:hypothetical protein
MSESTIDWGSGLTDDELREWARSPRAQVTTYGVQEGLWGSGEKMVRVSLGHQSAIVPESKARDLGFQFGLFLFLLCCLLGGAARAQETKPISDCPRCIMQPGHWSKYNRTYRYEHKFWDRQQEVAFAVSTAFKVADLAQTCHHLAAPDWHERWMPTQSCAGLAGLGVAGTAMQLVGGDLMHRHHHHRIERWIPWIVTAGSAFGITFSFTP